MVGNALITRIVMIMNMSMTRQYTAMNHLFMQMMDKLVMNSRFHRRKISM